MIKKLTNIYVIHHIKTEDLNNRLFSLYSKKIGLAS